MKFVIGESTCLSDDSGSGREPGGHRLSSCIFLLVQPEVPMSGGKFIQPISGLLSPLPGRTLGGGDTAVSKLPLPSWSLPSKRGGQRFFCLFVIDGIIVKKSVMVSGTYCHS